MPRYHFNVQDGAYYPDVEGADYPDLASVRAAAVEKSSALLRDSAVNFWNGDAWKLIVTDASGLTLFTLNFMAVNAPATQRYDARFRDDGATPDAVAIGAAIHPPQ